MMLVICITTHSTEPREHSYFSLSNIFIIKCATFDLLVARFTLRALNLSLFMSLWHDNCGHNNIAVMCFFLFIRYEAKPISSRT